MLTSGVNQDQLRRVRPLQFQTTPSLNSVIRLPLLAATSPFRQRSAAFGFGALTGNGVGPWLASPMRNESDKESYVLQKLETESSWLQRSKISSLDLTIAVVSPRFHQWVKVHFRRQHLILEHLLILQQPRPVLLSRQCLRLQSELDGQRLSITDLPLQDSRCVVIATLMKFLSIRDATLRSPFLASELGKGTPFKFAPSIKLDLLIGAPGVNVYRHSQPSP
mmetsp:Transcript_19558/g.61256  ORF Transcript_19558/g.61256 Transcript_19558/m.61256 type:complete len:222 (+) Transcript_19558:98-763(+)